MGVENPVEELKRRLRLPRWSPRSVVAVAGSGVSIQASTKAATVGQPAAGPPPPNPAAWRGLLQLGIDQADRTKRKPPRWSAASLHQRLQDGDVDDLLDVASEVETQLRSAKELRRFLDATIGKLHPHQPDVLSALYQLGVPMATTNYDGLIEWVLDGMQPLTWTHSAAVDEWFDGRQPGVLHLHGHFGEPDSIVLGRKTYDHVLEHGHAQNTLRNLFQQRTLVFVGISGSLEDPNFRSLLDWAIAAKLPTDCFHVVLVREKDAGAFRARYSVGTGLRIVTYGREYADLPTFIRSLLPDSRTGSPQPAPGRIASPDRLLPAVVRARLADAFPTSVDFETFVVDYFPTVYQQFTSNMQRSQQENLLLTSPERLPRIADLVEAELRRQGRMPADEPSRSVLERSTAHVESPAVLSNVPAAPTRYDSPQPQRHQSQPSGSVRKSAWSALLRLDRIEQYGHLMGTQQHRALNQLVLLYGHEHQSISLFVQRIEQYLHDDIRCQVVTVPMFQDQSRARTGTTWALHLKNALEDHLRETERSLPALLAQATEHAPILISLVSSANPQHILSDLTLEQLTGLEAFVTEVLPKQLVDVANVIVLLAIDHNLALFERAKDWASRTWHDGNRTFTELPELKMPSWKDVYDYLRGYRPPLANLQPIIDEMQRAYQELVNQPGATFEQLARKIDQVVLKHG